MPRIAVTAVKGTRTERRSKLGPPSPFGALASVMTYGRANVGEKPSNLCNGKATNPHGGSTGNSMLAGRMLRVDLIL